MPMLPFCPTFHLFEMIEGTKCTDFLMGLSHKTLLFFLINPLKAKTRKSGIAKNLDASTHMFRSPTIYH
jgi:hypothetical protein